MDDRVCQRPGCGRPMPSRKRRDARWCSRSCESKARRKAARRAAFEAANPGAAELLGEEASLTELYNRARRPDHRDDEPTEFSDDEHQDDEPGIYYGGGAFEPEWTEQDRRVNAMLTEDEDRKTPWETWKAWRAYGRRHGTEPPEQTADRIDRHRASEAARTARIDSRTAGRVQDRFDPRTGANVAGSAIQSRALNARHVEQRPLTSSGFDFQGGSVNSGPYRSGRASRQGSRHADYAWRIEDGFRF